MRGWGAGLLLTLIPVLFEPRHNPIVRPPRPAPACVPSASRASYTRCVPTNGMLIPKGGVTT